MRINVVVAMDRRAIIGRVGGLPWHLPADLKHFRTITLGHPLVMGRRTHESIGRPLPGRINIVVTRTRNYLAAGCLTADSFEAALQLAETAAEVMVIGGVTLYRSALPVATRMFLTEVHAELAGDVRFPDFDRRAWTEQSREDHPADDEHAYPYSFVVLTRAAACGD